MNKEYKPLNNSYREHWKLHGYLSPTMIEELLDLVDDKDDEITKLTEQVDDLDRDVQSAYNEVDDLNTQVRALEDEIQELS